MDTTRCQGTKNAAARSGFAAERCQNRAAGTFTFSRGFGNAITAAAGCETFQAGQTAQFCSACGRTEQRFGFGTFRRN